MGPSGPREFIATWRERRVLFANDTVAPEGLRRDDRRRAAKHPDFARAGRAEDRIREIAPSTLLNYRRLMTHTTSLILPQLSSKLLLLYAHSGIRSDKELAERLKVSKATISTYAYGDASKGRDPGLVPQDSRRELAAVLVQTSSNRLSSSRAEALWLGPFDAFARALAGTPATSLDQTLASNSCRLEVEVGVVDTGELSLMDEPPKIPDGAVVIRPKQQIFFELPSTRPGSCLTVVVETTMGWVPFIPGPRHTGHVESRHERIPKDPKAYVRFKPEDSVDRFVFLETRTSEPIFPNARERVGPLEASELEQLVDSLLDRRQVPDWRWEEVYIAVQQQQD